MAERVQGATNVLFKTELPKAGTSRRRTKKRKLNLGFEENKLEEGRRRREEE